MNRTEISYTLEGIEAAAREIASAIGDRRHIAFIGSMGAGKTTLIAALCRLWGADADDIASPTFAIVNEYHTPDIPLYHFDFYRIESPEEAVDLGLQDYLDADARCLMEWPDRVGSLLPDDLLVVEIRQVPGDDDARAVTVREADTEGAEA